MERLYTVTVDSYHGLEIYVVFVHLDKMPVLQGMLMITLENILER